jgi:hypothetical protein
MGKTSPKPVNGVLTPLAFEVATSRLTRYAQDVHYIIHRPSELAMPKAWWNFGTKQLTDLPNYQVTPAQLKAMSALGVMCALAFHYGATLQPWLEAYMLFEHLANAKPEQTKFLDSSGFVESRKSQPRLKD